MIKVSGKIVNIEKDEIDDFKYLIQDENDKSLATIISSSSIGDIGKRVEVKVHQGSETGALLVFYILSS